MALKNTYQAKKRFTKTPVKSTGMWYQDGDVIVPSNQITMKGPQGQSDYFNSPILGVGMQSGETQIMQPGREYLFPNDNSVFETRMQNGGLFSVGPYDEMMAPKQGNYLLPDINRPYYIDDEGGRRSEYRTGINIDGKETLLPTVVGGRQLTDEQAEDQYMRTGLNMGKFNTIEDADYASRLRTARYNMFADPIRFNQNQFQVGGETSTEQNPTRMAPINISTKRRNQDYRTYQDNTINNNQIVPSEFRGRRYIQPTLSEYVEPSLKDKLLRNLASPMTALSNNRTGSRNPYDYALDMVNPFSWIESGEKAVGSLAEGQYTDAALNALGALPAIGFADDAARFASKAGKYATTKTPLKNAFSSVDDAGKLGNYQKILDQGLDIHDVRLKYHNNMLLDFDESSMLNKFGKGNKSNYEKALVEDISGKMHTDDIAPKINKNLSGKEIMDGLLGKEQVKVTVPNKNITPIENNSNIVIKDFIDEEQNIIVPKKIEIPSFRSDPYQRTSTSRAADKWLEDWFTNPETKQKFIEYGGTEKEWTGILNSLENPIKSNYKWGKNQPGGVYMKLFDQASIPLDATVDIGVHEGIHKAKLLLQKENPILHRLWNDLTDAVRLTPSEAYPEIFRFRQKLGLKPGQTIDLKTMEDNLHLISDGYSMNYKIKDKNKLLEIINKAPALIPAAMGVGASQLQEKKYGGLQQSYKKTKRFK